MYHFSCPNTSRKPPSDELSELRRRGACCLPPNELLLPPPPPPVGAVPTGLEPGERESGEVECWRVCCRWPAAWTAAGVAPWLEPCCGPLAFVDIERGFEGPVEDAVVVVEEET